MINSETYHLLIIGFQHIAIGTFNISRAKQHVGKLIFS